MHALKYVKIYRLFFFKLLFQANLSNILMCVLLYLLTCTVLRAHISVVEVLYKIIIIIVASVWLFVTSKHGFCRLIF